jgi:putative phosphoribosyl transferase
MAATPSSFDASPSRAFADRRHAGRELAERLRGLIPEQPVVLGLPRGGVPVAYEIAAALGAPLDVLVARKIGAPRNPELGIGAVAEGGVRVLSEDAIRNLSIGEVELERAVAQAAHEVGEGERRYRAGRPPIPLWNRMVVVVDDGLATGGTARAALRAVSQQGARRVVLAVPVAASAAVTALRGEADAIVCLLAPEPLWAIGLWYEDFAQVSDEEVHELLTRPMEIS